MKIEPVNDRVAGVEISQSHIKAVVLAVDKGQPILEWSSEVAIGGPHSAGDDVNPLYSAREKALGELSDELVVSCVESPDVLVRQVNLDVTKERDIESVIEFQIEPLLPFPLEEAVVDHVVLEREKSSARIAVLTMQKVRLAAHLERLRAAGLDPERTSCVPAALATLLYRLLPSDEPQGVFHLGDDYATCTIVRKGKVLATRAVTFGAVQLSELLAGDDTDLSDFDSDQYPKLHKRLERFRQEVSKTFVAMTTRRGQGVKIAQIFVAGEIRSFRNLDVYLSKAIEHPLTDLPQHSPFTAPLGDVTKYAVPLGLAMMGLPIDVLRVDFRKNDYVYPRPWRRLQKKIIAYFVACIALTGAVAGLGKAMRVQTERSLREEYQALVQYTDQEAAELQKVTPEAIVQGARHLSLKAKQIPETFALVPVLPRVCDVLAWIASHPNVTTVDPQTGNKKALITIESFQYAMVKRPTARNPAEKYQVRVDVEFSADNPTAARELHDALREPNPYIDPKSEIRWAGNREKYRTSFVLKDMTHYPQTGGGA